MWIFYKEFGNEVLINTQLVSKIEINNAAIYFYGAPCADDEGGIFPALIDFIEFKSKKFATDCFRELTARLVSPNSVYSIPKDWILEDSEPEPINQSLN